MIVSVDPTGKPITRSGSPWMTSTSTGAFSSYRSISSNTNSGDQWHEQPALVLDTEKEMARRSTQSLGGHFKIKKSECVFVLRVLEYGGRWQVVANTESISGPVGRGEYLNLSLLYESYSKAKDTCKYYDRMREGDPSSGLG